MKHNTIPKKQSHTLPDAPRTAPWAAMSRGEIDFVPSPDEVARRAYFAFENQGSSEGQHVQHWLSAEAELIAEHQLTRTHQFHNRT